MINSTQFSYFILSAYIDSGTLKYFYFMIFMVLYMLIVFANTLLLFVICLNKSLHEPMYLFLCSLFLNQVYGSTGLLPFLMIQMLSDTHTISISCCYLQIFCLYSYASVEFNILAAMSYDRYIAIYFPLQYHIKMKPSKVLMLVILIWLYSCIKLLITLSLGVRLPLCGNIIDKVYCDNYLVVKLACTETRVNNIYGLFSIALTVLVPLIPILFSYIKILRICLTGSKDTRQKAFNTCTPHLASLLNFSFGCIFVILQSRFNMSSVPNLLQNILSMYFLICQSLLNPIMYGLRLTKIRNTCRNLLFRSK